MKFSIITPSYNQLDWLELCIRSVADQIQPIAESGVAGCGLQVEHIVQDGGTEGFDAFRERIELQVAGCGLSNDRMSSMRARQGGEQESENVQPAAGNYQLRLYSEPDAGMYDAINRGYRKATGDILAYINCDEQYLEGALLKVAEVFRSDPELDLLFGDAVVVDPDGEYVCSRRVVVPQRIHTCVCHLNTLTASTFMRRRVVSEQELYVPGGWRNCGDAAWVVRCLDAGLKMKALNEYLAVFTDTGENMNMNAEGEEEKVRMREFYPLLKHTAPLWVVTHRLRKFFRGLYRLEPFTYGLYTGKTGPVRKTVRVEKPSTVWADRFSWRR